MKKKLALGFATGLFLFGIVGTAQAAFFLDFEGLGDQEQILDFYNGGTGGNGSNSGTDYGINFGSNALAIIDADAGGSGNFGGEPSPDTVMFFLTGSAVLNKEDGFDTGFSFSYSAINNPGNVIVYDGLNATGNVLANISLPATDSDGGDPNGNFSPFYNVGAAFSGTAKSIDFGGTVNQIAFDDITFNSATPGTETDMPFLVGDQETNPTYLSRITNFSFDSESDSIIQHNGEFVPYNPTYVITHGWQPSQDHIDTDFNFSDLDKDGFLNEYEEIPEVQRNILETISDRLDFEADSVSGSLKANILVFEWEGAYTGGDGNDEEYKVDASREARVNAEYAGVLLGNTLVDVLGEEYAQDVHFIGHSYGTIVNGLATRFLEGQNIFVSDENIQFTVLDAPTNAPFNSAPNFDSDWFTNNLSPEVDYVDNYYGTNGPGNTLAYGEPIDGSGFDQPVDFDHSGVAQEFYPDLVLSGPNAITNPNLGGENHLFDDWITPLLATYYGRPGDDFSTVSTTQWNNAISGSDFEDAIGESVIVASLPGYDGYAFDGLVLEEQSPVSVYQLLTLPEYAEWLAFDWMVGAGGDGDWATVHFGSELLWSMAIDELFDGVLLDAIIDISAYAGMQDNLYFTLNSVGESNAEFYFGNLEIIGSQVAAVPEPSTFILFLIGLAGIGLMIERQLRLTNFRGQSS